MTEKKPAAPAAGDKTESATTTAADKSSRGKAPAKGSSLAKGSLSAEGSSSAKGSLSAEGSSLAKGSLSAEGSSSAEGSLSAEGSKPVGGSKQSFSWFKTLLLFLLIAVLAGSSWFGWMQWQQRTVLADSLQASLVALDNKIDQQRQASVRVEQQQLQTINDLQDQLYSLRLLTNRQAEQILTLGTATRGDWLLAEAAYLVRLANQRLQVERSIENPLAILQNVDNIFIQLNDAELLAVRNALAVDIAALRMTERVDRDGIYLELQAISAALETLTVLEPTADSEVPQRSNSAERGPATLAEIFERLATKFAGLIIVQKRQQPIEPLLTQAEQTMVRQNLYLLLQQAQSALLREEQLIYSSSLDKTETLLRRYFQLNNESEALLARLQALSKRAVSQSLPDISGSQKAIQTALNLRHGGSADEGSD